MTRKFYPEIHASLVHSQRERAERGGVDTSRLTDEQVWSFIQEEFDRSGEIDTFMVTIAIELYNEGRRELP